MQTIPASEGDWDTHQVCSACLGLKHAHRSRIPVPVNTVHAEEPSSLARQANLLGQDTLMSPSPAPAATPHVSNPVELPTTAALSWGEQLDACVPLPTVPSTDEEEDVLNFEEEGQSDFFSLKKRKISRSPLSFPLHTLHSSLRGSMEVASRASSAPLLSVDLQDVCKNTAEKLNIPWPNVVADTRYEELLKEVAVTWKDKLFTSKMPVQGGSALDMVGIEKEGLL
ncbi:hypothetical protein DPX16_5398 [Anabarilius grahami]|uniref:Uncharacterized protein n=1 Tax=Anabarilius grahami TaxID=495550 RepID=A0A3N0YGU8_ANAGA|nr:hypothetical protein DPX16_5398 [Anabarilius grahami]